jgi:hypothetical protein
MADKIEWMKKIRGIIESKGGSVKGSNTPEGGPIRQSRSDGSLVSSTICLTCVFCPCTFIHFEAFRTTVKSYLRLRLFLLTVSVRCSCYVRVSIFYHLIECVMYQRKVHFFLLLCFTTLTHYHPFFS